MGAPADEVQVVDLVELIFRAAPEHLVKTVSQVEDRTSVAVVTPIFGRDDHLGDDVISQAFKPEFLFYLFEDTVSVSVFFLGPVDVFMDVRNGHQGVDR